MIMGNTHVTFLHIQIEYLKCDFWEFESTQNHLWLIFNKCLKLLKWLFYYFYCMWSTIILRVVLFYLNRENSQLSIEIGFTKFGSSKYFKLVFESSHWIKSKLKRKRIIWIHRLRREGLLGRPTAHSAARGLPEVRGGLTSGTRVSVSLNKTWNGTHAGPFD